MCEDGCVEQGTQLLMWQLGPGLTRMWVSGQYLQQAQDSNRGISLGTKLAVWLKRSICRGELVPLSKCWRWEVLYGV